MSAYRAEHFVVFEQQAGVRPETLEGDPAFRDIPRHRGTDAWAPVRARVRERLDRPGPGPVPALGRHAARVDPAVPRAGGRLRRRHQHAVRRITIQPETRILREVGLLAVEAITAATGEAARVARLPSVGVDQNQAVSRTSSSSRAIRRPTSGSCAGRVPCCAAP